MNPQATDLLVLTSFLLVGAACLLVVRAVYLNWRRQQRLAELARRDRARQEHPELGREDASKY